MTYSATFPTTCSSTQCVRGGEPYSGPINVGDEVLFKYDPYTMTEELFHAECPVGQP
jgi:hypothetical protein